MNAVQVLSEIREVAKKNNGRDEAHKTRVVNNLKVGECYRQGDIYVFKVKDSHPVGDEVKIRQIVDGVSLGARHCLVGGFKVYQGKKFPIKVGNLHKRVALGYAFDVLTPGTINTHPEHDNFKFDQCGRYQVIHQVDLQTLRKVAD